MSNRLEDDSTCLMCGGVIIELEAALKMCSACQKMANDAARYQIANRKSRTGLVKRKNIRIKELRKP